MDINTLFVCFLNKTYQKISSYNKVQEILGGIYLRFVLKLGNSIEKRGNRTKFWVKLT